MAPALPSSLSPHICILPSPDLEELLESSSLPPLPQILQSFSPLPQVTTRTTSLTSIPHTSFALRFSDLSDIEAACREDEEQRAERTLDWIGERINKSCAKWVEDIEKTPDKDAIRTPWWDELRRCTEGELVPSRTEGWNHPVSIILAVSTTAPNPLQAITALHSRMLDFPSWVDTTHFIYTLIIHPHNSALSDEEAGALFNAVKKQYGLQSYLLPLSLPSPPPPPVPVPALMPRLPPPYSTEKSNGAPDNSRGETRVALNTLKMAEQDIQQTAKFTREFVIMSLVPWMERCVVEWNENYSSSRRLPSRLFSSTRRLFGSTTSSNAASAHSSSPSVSSLPSRSHTYSASQASMTGSTIMKTPPSQQRRLAEFATVLGDIKLAANVWESLRKEGKGGSDILPLLSAPSPTVPLHVSNALSSLFASSVELPSLSQLRALTYAVRWEIGISHTEFSGKILEGERWLVWAAGTAEEPPSALLLAQAAMLSARKPASRRAALWYLSAANRLEKCGIKPLTMYFLRKAHELFKMRPDKALSPSFWESEGKDSTDYHGFDAVMSGIEHPLGRLLYTTGDLSSAVRFFLGLLKPQSSLGPGTSRYENEENKAIPSTDKVFLEDFRVAFAHFKSTSGEDVTLPELKLPFTLAVLNQTRIRFPRDSVGGEQAEWDKREETWVEFWKSRGKEKLEKSGKGAVEETFWVDIVLRNPLDAEINISNVTLIVKESLSHDPQSASTFVEVENIEEITLGARESRTVPISIKSCRATSLIVSHVTYDFLSLLPSTESLARRGRRLQDTPQQRQTVMYAPDIHVKVEVEEASQKLNVVFADSTPLELLEGERKPITIQMYNAGKRNLGDIWMITGADDEVWLGTAETASSTSPTDDISTEIFHSDNKLPSWTPIHVEQLENTEDSSSLDPGACAELNIVLHAGPNSHGSLSVLFVYREQGGETFHCTRAMRNVEITPLLKASATSQPSRSDHSFSLNLELENVSNSNPVLVTQVTTISPAWTCTPISELWSEPLSSHQTAHLFLGASTSSKKPHNAEGITAIVNYASQKLSDVLQGHSIEPTDPPPIDLICSHISKGDIRSVNGPSTCRFIRSGRGNIISRSLKRSFPHIPAPSHPHIFPLYSPLSVDVIFYWEIPSQRRSGHLFLSDITLGAGHAALRDIIQEAESTKAKRSMYAETQREKHEILEAIRDSEWNVETNPTVIAVESGRTVEHDFAKGPCQAQVGFTIRNCSLTHSSRFLLRLQPRTDEPLLSSTFLPPCYTGRLTFRGTLKPSTSTTARAKLYTTCPGIYALVGWSLETEVGEACSQEDSEWKTRHRYMQHPRPGDESSITVSDVSEP
ncbi:hypothetical protein SERLA73DRAFT_68802 [Serpula lacrymans var. lacrymans S7.3]|uniref:TPPC8 first Ig-like domain-containing protein n=2 Tax=Serpula lacrymans var. lacrymans TaxID=341189 RepID=F8PID0_SERL3|nr:uncharacterized protein SERLADRAFT_432574 [Serpula lacrymans var. lacrymans S7.9]EGO05173.1 hypothetical protein SERLA73DRAFT_68802 [Serpula lacrymans var. lacrymans S7.3]EGO30913.1 hypothetical protein SERLADRAFT_432574 [Serpula lacrymans var. lacrymans S7.9]